jgi:uncharacterized membrane protein
VVQHVATFLALVWDIGGLRASFAVDYTLLVGGNIILAAVYLIALYGTIKRQLWGPIVVIGPALFDIIAEFVFHGIFFITVSVIVAVLLLFLALAEYRYRIRERRAVVRKDAKAARSP